MVSYISFIIKPSRLVDTERREYRMNFLASVIAILLIAVMTGFVFLWAGIMGSLMIDYFVYNETVNLFTYIGFGLGGVLGCIAVWCHERKKYGQG